MELSNIANNVEKRINDAELFTRRFGSFSKADYEVLMFTAFLDSIETPMRDYDISVALGITESKVRNLRVRSQLLYPKELKWQAELAAAVSHGYYDSLTKQITITIEDPSVQSLLKNIVEKNYGVVGQTLNMKQLVLPVESFLMLAAYAEEEPKKVIDNLKNEARLQSKDIAKIEDKGLKTKFLQFVPDAVGFLSTAVSLYEVGRPIVESVINLIQFQ